MSLQPFPSASAPAVDPNTGILSTSWLRFMVWVWTQIGQGSASQTFTTGDIKESAAPGAQPGWLVCDGSETLIKDQPALYAKIGRTYGVGDGVTSFNLPNRTGRGSVGTGSGYALGQTGGSSTATLTATNLPIAAANTVTAGAAAGGVSAAVARPFSVQSPYVAFTVLIKT